jgi:hypothetical protein
MIHDRGMDDFDLFKLMRAIQACFADGNNAIVITV